MEPREPACVCVLLHTTAAAVRSPTRVSWQFVELTATGPHLPPTVQPVRAAVWLFHLALPLAGLWLLLGEPSTDLVWHDAVSHFWLVVVVALVNVVLGARMATAAHRRSDAR